MYSEFSLLHLLDRFARKKGAMCFDLGLCPKSKHPFSHLSERREPEKCHSENLLYTHILRQHPDW
jgi:hypothetical protein